jgi:hypothetical protein
MEHYYATFKYFDRKGRRLAAFARYRTYNEAELFVLTCSLEDNFSKKLARRVYEKYLTIGLTPEFTTEYKPLIELVEIKPEKGEVQTLLDYCNKNYYIEAEVEVTEHIPVLFNQDREEAIGELTIKLKTF